MKTTYITERDVIQVANELEQIVTSEIVDKVLEHFDDEMATEDKRTYAVVIQDLINEFKTEQFQLQRN